MATTFDFENPHGESLETPDQLRSFYKKMVNTVVSIRVPIPTAPEMVASGDQRYMNGGGAVYDAYGHIITCWHTFSGLPDESLENIEIQRWTEPFIRARLILRAPNLDCAILRPCDAVKNNRPFASFVSSTAIDYGVQAFAIGHPGPLQYSMYVGKIAYSNSSMADILEILTQEEAVQFVEYGRDMTLVQLINIHGAPGLSGSPVFTNTGRIIGLSILGHLHQTFASHSKDLRRLAKSAKRKITKFWSVEVLPSQTVPCHLGSSINLHITQACLGVTNTDEDVSLSLTTKSERYVVATLSGGRTPQAKLNLFLDGDFEFANSSTTATIFVCGNKFLGRHRSGDSDEDIEDVGQSNPRDVSSEEDGTILVNFESKKNNPSFFNRMINCMRGRKKRTSK